jgi:DNA-directed RNA polymerase specialized sigma24 family protein
MHNKPGRQQQVGEFFAANNGKLQHAVARKITAPQVLIEDACATAWVILLRRPDVTLDHGGRAWLTTVAINEALRLLHRTRGETTIGTFQGDPHGHTDGDEREPANVDAAAADERALARIEHAEPSRRSGSSSRANAKRSTSTRSATPTRRSRSSPIRRTPP